jgi:hypothetical protein
MIRYAFREDAPLIIKNAKDADPQKIGEALDEIREANGGRLTTKDTVTAARDRKSVLNQHFEWNIQAAAEAHWLEQARHLIASIRIVSDEHTESTVRAYFSINDGDGQAYRSVGEIKSSADLQAALMAQADRELEAWQRRYRSLVEVCEDIQKVREKLRRKAARQEKDPRR